MPGRRRVQSAADTLAAWCREVEALNEPIRLDGVVRYLGRSRGGAWDRYRCRDGSMLEVSTAADGRGRRLNTPAKTARKLVQG